jgi:hypothetical protein
MIDQRRGQEMPIKNTKAEHRRDALRHALAAANMRPSDAARAAGFTTANQIFNFLNGRANSLSQDTIERLAQVIPGSSIASLTANETRQAPISAIQGVIVRAVAEGGKMRDSFDVPKREQFEVALPVEPEHQRAGAFGVSVHAPGFERVFPNGTILVCVPIPQYKAPLVTGTKLILQRVVGKDTEVTVRELRIDPRERAWLWLRSDDPEHQSPIEMPWPFTNEMWKQDTSRFAVTAVVVGAYMPQV